MKDKDKPEQDKVRLTAYVDRKFYTLVRIEAAKRGVSMSTLVETILRKEIK